MSLQDYQKTADSINLSEIGDTVFTVTHIEDSPYVENGKEPQPGVKITTKETWTRAKDGEKVNKIHTTRRAIVSMLSNANLRKDVNENNKTLKLRCPKEKVKPKGGGQPYFTLVDAQ
jgi:hypothetical protein